MSIKKIKAKCYAQDRLEDYFSSEFLNRYKDEFAELAYKILSAPGTQEMLAKECGVTVRTIQRWKQPKFSDGTDNPDFKPKFAEYYLLGEIAQKAGYDVIALQNLQKPNKHFNPALYFGERKRLHAFSDDRTIKIPELKEANDYKAQAEVLRDKFADGVITAAEFKKATDALYKISEVIDLLPLKEEVRQLKEAQNNA